MADQQFKVGLIFSAVDRASSVIRGITKSTAGLKAAQATSAKMFSAAANVRQAAMGVSAVANAMQGAISGPIKEFERFEQAMANVRSKTKATDEEFKQMTARAREMGSLTEFSAVEAAQGMEFLVMASFDAKQAMSVIPDVLSLASAAGTDLGRTSDIMSDIMGQFGLKAEDATSVVDNLTRAFTGSNTTLETLFETFKLAGPGFRQLGIPLKDALTYAGIIGGAGLKGSTGGTALRSISRGFTGKSGKAQKVLKGLRITTTDDAGDLIKPLEIYKQVLDKIKGFGNVKKANTLADLFGLRGTTGASTILEAVKNGDFKRMAAQMDDMSITAEKVSAVRLDTAAGRAKILTSATKELQIELGGTLSGAIKSVTLFLTELLKTFTQLAKDWPTLTKALMLTAAVSAILVTALAGLLFVVSTLLSAAGLWVLIPVALGIAKAFAAAAFYGVLPLATAFAKMGFAALAAVSPLVLPLAAFLIMIGAITLAVVTLAKHWDELDFGKGLQGIKESVFGEGDVGLGDLAASPLNAVKTYMQMMDPRTLVRDLGGGDAVDTLNSGIDKATDAVAGLLRIEVVDGQVTSTTLDGKNVVLDAGEFATDG